MNAANHVLFYISEAETQTSLTHHKHSKKAIKGSCIRPVCVWNSWRTCLVGVRENAQLLEEIFEGIMAFIKKKKQKNQYSKNTTFNKWKTFSSLENKMYMYFSTFLNALLNLIHFRIKTKQVLFSALKTSVHTCFILHWLFTDKAFTSQTSLSSQLSKLNVFQVVIDTYSM